MPKLVIAPVIGIAADELPAWAGVERTVSADCEAWPVPHRGISSSNGGSPTLTDPARAWREYVPVAHFQYAKNEANASDEALPRIRMQRGQVRANRL